MSASITPPPGETITPPQKQEIRSLATNMQIVAVLLLVLAVVYVGLGGLAIFLDAAYGAGLFSVVQGVLFGLTGLMVLTGSGDARYLAETQGADREHLTNTVNSLTMAANVQLAWGILLAVVSVVGLLF